MISGHFVHQWIISLLLHQQSWSWFKITKSDVLTVKKNDTLISNQMLRLLDELLSQDICVCSLDTDVVVLLLD